MKTFCRYIIISLSLFSFSCHKKVTCEKLRKGFFLIKSDFKTKQDSINLYNDLNYIIKHNPSCKKAIQFRGVLNYEGMKFREAKDDFLKSIKIDSMNAFSNYFLGLIASREGNIFIALKYFNKAKEIKLKEGYEIFHIEGFVNDRNNDFNEEFDVKFDMILSTIGSVLYDLNYYDEAKYYLRISERDLEFRGVSAKQLSVIYYKEGNIDSACYYYSKALQVGITDVTNPGCE